MARKKRPTDSGHVLFDVVYADGVRTSNRKVPSNDLGGLDGDKPALAFIEAQDRKIAAISGLSRGEIKSIARAPRREQKPPGRRSKPSRP